MNSAFKINNFSIMLLQNSLSLIVYGVMCHWRFVTSYSDALHFLGVAWSYV
jgi:hypothetical protein